MMREWLRVLPCRLWLYVRIVGREWHSFLGPVLAWQIVARVHPVSGGGKTGHE